MEHLGRYLNPTVGSLSSPQCWFLTPTAKCWYSWCHFGEFRSDKWYQQLLGPYTEISQPEWQGGLGQLATSSKAHGSLPQNCYLVQACTAYSTISQKIKKQVVGTRKSLFRKPAERIIFNLKSYIVILMPVLFRDFFVCLFVFVVVFVFFRDGFYWLFSLWWWLFLSWSC